MHISNTHPPMADAQIEQKKEEKHEARPSGRLKRAREAHAAELATHKKRIEESMLESALRIKEFLAALILCELEDAIRGGNFGGMTWDYKRINKQLRAALSFQPYEVNWAYLKEHVEPLVQEKEPAVCFVDREKEFDVVVDPAGL